MRLAKALEKLSSSFASLRILVLDWSKKLVDGVSFFTKADPPAELRELLKSCGAVVEPTVGYGGVGNAADICLSPDVFDCRCEESEAMSFFIKDQGAEGKAHRVSPGFLKRKEISTHYFFLSSFLFSSAYR